MQLLPPKPGTCPACAVAHKATEPHNAQSLYYQYRFYGLRGRWPTWADAVAHCSPQTRALWERALRERKAWTEPGTGQTVVADPPEECIAQPIGDLNSHEFEPDPSQ
jgi:hypothetical protein